jgi:hypothetical protein
MVADIIASCYALDSKLFFPFIVAPTVVARAKLGDVCDQVVEKNGASFFSSTSLVSSCFSSCPAPLSSSLNL